ncbi:MAG: hypothetical protein U0V54_10650 [Saprospiraceae bacterium]
MLRSEWVKRNNFPSNFTTSGSCNCDSIFGQASTSCLKRSQRINAFAKMLLPLEKIARQILQKVSFYQLTIDFTMENNLSQRQNVNHSAEKFNFHPFLVFITLLWITSFQTVAAQGAAQGSNGIRFSRTAAIVMDKTISYGSTLDMGMLKPETTWEIEDQSGVIASGSGNELNEYVFGIPGDYQVNIHENIVIEPGSCSHNTCPDMITLHVSNVRMTFHHSEITFSDSLRVGVGAEDITMLVPVTIERYNKYLPIEYNATEVRTAGVGTEIVAELDSQTQLREGKQVLTYQLAGKASKPAYIMFDFIDTNGMVQSYAMPFPIAQ